MKLFLVAGVLGAIVALAPPASAQGCQGEASVVDGGGGSDAWCDGAGSTPGTNTSHEVLWGRYCENNFGSPWPFEPGFTVWFYLEDVIDDPEVLADMGRDPTRPLGAFVVFCQYGPGDNDNRFWDYLFWEVDTPPTPEEVRDRARAQIFPPDPVMELSPALDSAVVGLDTWLWVTTPWEPITVVEIDGGLVVEVQALPTQTTWTFGPGGDQICAGPGVEWSEDEPGTYCLHRSESSSATQPDQTYASSVAITWDFQWWLNGVDQGVFGTIDTTTTFDVQVGEIQAIETGR
jgi:hypothetical protein